MFIKVLLLTLTLLISFASLSQDDYLEQGIYELNRGEFKAAIAEFQPLVDEGYAPAQYQMALIYQNGYGVSKDPMKALALLTLSAEKNYIDAQFELALLYSAGKLVKKDLKKAFTLTHKAAKKGLPSAQFNVAVMHANGTGVKQNYFSAARWYQHSANQNHSLAQYNLALLYSEGKGVEKSTGMSFVWNTIAAWNGYTDAEKSRIVDLRELSLKQRAVEVNTEKANKIYQEIIAKQEKQAKNPENKTYY